MLDARYLILDVCSLWLVVHREVWPGIPSTMLRINGTNFLGADCEVVPKAMMRKKG